MDGIERFGRDFMKAQQWGDFARLDADALRRYSDAELAAWQSEYPSDSPQWLLAEQQWKLRLLERQAQAAARQANKAAIISGVAGGIMGIAGALLGAWLSWLLAK